MRDVIYERPREKLRSRGVKNLTQAELIQLVIGSGTAKYPVGKLARQVGVILKSDPVTFESLCAIPGLGEAKACQILASVELGVRAFNEVANNKTTNEKLLIELVEKAQALPSPVFAMYLFDGARTHITSSQFTPKKGEHYSVLVKRMFAEALVRSARSMVLAIVVKKVAPQPNPMQIGVMNAVHETAAMLDIQVLGIHAVSRKESVNWGNYGQ